MDRRFSMIEELIGRLGAVDLRRAQIVCHARAASGEGLLYLLATNALSACAEDGNDPESPQAYERWRSKQACAREWPTANLIAICFNSSWAAALDNAGLAVTAIRRTRARKNREGGYTGAEIETAIRIWLDETDAASLRLSSYLEWANKKAAEDPEDDTFPLHSQTIARHHGTWKAVVDAAYPDANSWRKREAKRERAARREHYIRHLRRAADMTGRDLGTRRLSLRLTRAVYDTWKRTQRASTVSTADLRDEIKADSPPRSEAIQREFGTWRAALAAAAAAGNRKL